MKFATIETPDGLPAVVLVNSETRRYWPVSSLIPGFNGDMNQLILQCGQFESDLVPVGQGQPLEHVTLKAPISPQRNLFCVGKNYHEHAAEFSKSAGDRSVFRCVHGG